MKTYCLTLNDFVVTVEKKRVKNINLAVYPPDGRIRVSAPMRCSEKTIRSVILQRLPWLERKRAAFLAQPVAVMQQMVTGEQILFFGEQYPLEVVERTGTPGMRFVDGRIELGIAPGVPTEKRKNVLDEWYRQQLRARIPELIARWQPVIGVTVQEWRIRRMKSRWGTCNISDRRIWLNLELARMPPDCLEYVVVHELVHLLERYHNSRFWGFMDQFLPHWRDIRQELKTARLA